MTCNNCFYFFRLAEKIGQCRRYPPRAPDEGKSALAIGGREGWGLWLKVAHDGWCGEWTCDEKVRTKGTQ
jgi:hypothetical protein